MNEQSFKIIVTTLKGLEGVLEREIRALGVRRTRRLIRAVELYGDKALLYELNLRLSTALRILKPVAHLRNLKSVAAIYNKVYELPWEQWFFSRKSMYFHVSGELNTVPHTHFVSQKVKDAIADRFRERFGHRPDVRKENAEMRINLHLFRDQMTVSLDSSGEPLFKRGYRQETGPAPVNEVLAAGLIRLARWEGDSHLIDPMCGSGTIPVEGALFSKNIPPGMFRENFSFMHWNDYDEVLFKKIKERLAEKIKEPFELMKILGYDKDAAVLERAQKNAAHARVDDYVQCEVKDFFVTKKIPGPVKLIFNPPYDRRLPLPAREKFYRRIQDHLKEAYPFSEAWILTAEHPKKLFPGMKPFKVFSLMNGKIPVYFSGFKIDMA